MTFRAEATLPRRIFFLSVAASLWRSLPAIFLVERDGEYRRVNRFMGEQGSSAADHGRRSIRVHLARS
jgi:hypothetical protein